MTHIDHHKASTPLIDSLRSPKSTDYSSKMSAIVEKVLKPEDTDTLEDILLEKFPNNKHQVLREFFIDHPVCWIDLLRKLHKYKARDLEDEWFIAEYNIEDIYKTFLIRGRTNTNIGPKLRKVLPDAITKNQLLLEFASNQPSLLDSGGYSYSRLPKKERKKATIGLITKGLMENIDDCTYQNRDEYFQRIFPKIRNYLNDIFGINPNLSFCRNIEQLSKELEKMFDSGKGDDREDAFRVIQAFYAWSSIEQIEEMHEKACGIIHEVPRYLKQKTGLDIVIKGSSREEDGTIIHSGIIKLKEKEYTINWRIKSIKSILQKMWVTEEYTNIDAIRDMLGISIVVDDDTPEEVKIYIIGIFIKMMPEYGYLLKNKGLFSVDDIIKIQEIALLRGKAPIYTTSKRGDSTDEKFSNASLSGYIKIDNLDLGTEVQISTKSCMEWKKKDDKWYKPKDAILGFIRGPKFGTPGQFYKLLDKKIKSSTLQELGVNNINEIIIHLIIDGFIIPYVSGDGSIILLGCKGKKREFIFKRKFPTMEECKSNHKYYPELLDYLRRIKPLTYC